MPSQAAHDAAARSLEDLARHLLDSEWPSWAAVAAFYSALHRVDTYLSRGGIHPRDHRQREALIERDHGLGAIYGAYRTLRQRCDAVRYDLRPLGAEAAGALVDNELAAIRQHISRLLRP